MTRHDPIAERILRIAEPACTAAGYELWDVKFTMEQGGWILRVFIDRPPPEIASPGFAGARSTASAVRSLIDHVDLEDCERMSRELSALLDVEDPIPHAYSLEVSSPGIDRPLRTVDHFRRYVGAEAKIALATPLRIDDGGERRNFKGVLAQVEGDDPVDAIVVVNVDGKPFRLPIKDIEQAKVVPDWDEVLGTKPPPGGKQPKPKKQKQKH